jgi:hypothetical protein
MNLPNLPEDEKVYILAGTTGEYTAARQRMELIPNQAYWVTRVSNLKGLQAPRVYRVGSWRNLPKIDEIEAKLKEIKAVVQDLD